MSRFLFNFNKFVHNRSKMTFDLTFDPGDAWPWKTLPRTKVHPPIKFRRLSYHLRENKQTDVYQYYNIDDIDSSFHVQVKSVTCALRHVPCFQRAVDKSFYLTSRLFHFKLAFISRDTGTWKAPPRANIQLVYIEPLPSILQCSDSNYWLF